MKSKFYLIIILLTFSCSKFNRSSLPGLASKPKLSSLSFTQNSINYLTNFESSNKNYVFQVPEAVNSMVINANSIQDQTLIEVSSNKNSNVCSEKKSISNCNMPLDLGSNIITIKLSIHEYQIYYKAVITRDVVIGSVLANDINIYGANQNHYNFSFDKNIFNYSLTINTNETDVYFVVDPEVSGTTIKVNNLVQSCSFQNPCSVAILQDQTTINIKLQNEYSSKTYSFVLNKDTSAFLNDLKLLDNGTNVLNGFVNNIFNYNNIIVSPDSESIVLSINKKTGSSINIYKNDVLLNISGSVNGSYVNYTIPVPEIYPVLKVNSSSPSTTVDYKLYLNKYTNVNIGSISYALNGAHNFEFNELTNTFHKTFNNADILGVNSLAVTATSVYANAIITINYNSGESPFTKILDISTLSPENPLTFDVSVKQNSSAPSLQYVLKIEVLPAAVNHNSQLASLIIKDQNNNLISTLPSFSYSKYNYEAMIDPLKNNIKVSAISISQNATISISYAGNNTCTAVHEIVNCTINNINDYQDLQIMVSDYPNYNSYIVSFKEGYLIYKNTVSTMGGNPSYKDMFGEFMATSQIKIGNINYSYMLIGNPKENRVYVYRASVDQSGVYSNYILAETLDVNYGDGLNPYKFLNPIIPYNSVNSFSLENIDGFGASIAINENFILIGAPNTHIYESGSGCILSYRIDPSSGIILPHQLIIPTLGYDLAHLYEAPQSLNTQNLHFGYKLSLAKNSNILVVGDNIPTNPGLGNKKGVYAFYNTNNDDNVWIIGSNFSNNKFIKLETEYGTYSDIKNVIVSQSFIGACVQINDGNANAICDLYKYDITSHQYLFGIRYSDINWLGNNTDIIETSTYGAMFFSSEQDSDGALNFVGYNKISEDFFDGTITSGNNDEHFAHSLSIITKTINNVDRHFIFVGSPYDGQSNQGKFDIYELTSFSGWDFNYDLFNENISISSENIYEDDRIAYNMSVTQDFIVLSAPYYDTTSNQNQNNGAVVIFRTDLLFPQSNGTIIHHIDD